MKIHFSNVNFSSRSGPNSFAGRLAEQFTLMGHQVVEDPSHHYDVFLAFIEAASKPNPKTKKVLRLDGIWFSPDNFEKNNKNIKHCYKTFNTVIWQSEFDRAMTTKWFGKRDGYVIHNGINLKPAKPYPFPDKFDGFPDRHQYFVCSSNWHGQKRLAENIRLFQKIRAQLREKDIDSTLLILGNVPESLRPGVLKVYPLGSPERIAWLGNRPHDECMAIYAACVNSGGYMLHCAFADHCPNSVIEALGQHLPVLYASDGGGTKEIVKSGGIMIPSTKEYNFELMDYENPPLLNLEGFTLPDEPLKVSSNHLDIESVGRRYVGAMR